MDKWVIVTTMMVAIELIEVCDVNLVIGGTCGGGGDGSVCDGGESGNEW